MTSKNLLTAAKRDVTVFARELLGHVLWPHQVVMLKSPARITTVVAGRQCGKSWALASIALWWALRRPQQVVLLVSAGEVSAMRLLALCARLTQSTILEESLEGETTKRIVFSNGSIIRSAPASERSIRGEAIDLLVLDEASLIPSHVMTSALPGILARKGSRVIMCSTPWGSKDRYFASTWRLGMRGTDPKISGFHWPSSVSPMVDDEALELLRSTMTEREYRQEVEAIWTDDEGCYFSAALLEAVTHDYSLADLERDRGLILPCLGVDWGGVVDSNAMVGIGYQPDSPGRKADTATYQAIYVLERKGSTIDFVDEIVAVCQAFKVLTIASEVTGLGRPPTQLLQRKLLENKLHGTRVVEIDTSNRSKADGYGAVSLFFEQGRLLIPRRYPDLPRQLANLEMESTPTGIPRIEVPPTRGHDDLAVALMLAVSQLEEAQRRNWEFARRRALAAEQGPTSLTKASSWRQGSQHHGRGIPEPTHVEWPKPGLGWQ